MNSFVGAHLITTAMGIAAGLLYGLFFVIQQKRALFSSAQATIKKSLIDMALIGARLLICALFLYRVLLSPSINFILLLISFLGAFWLIILSKRA
jgi:hypothetical protein